MSNIHVELCGGRERELTLEAPRDAGKAVYGKPKHDVGMGLFLCTYSGVVFLDKPECTWAPRLTLVNASECDVDIKAYRR